jgi:hypothetical protein
MFRETTIMKSGSRSPEIIGGYVGLLSGPVMVGIYEASGKVLGQFILNKRPYMRRR